MLTEQLEAARMLVRRAVTTLAGMLKEPVRA